MERKEDMFGDTGDAIEEPAEIIEEQAQEPGAETPEAPAEQPEAPVEEKPAGTVEVPTPKPEPGFVPFAAVLDERDKRKALEQQLEQFRSQQQPKEAPKAPDMFEDPDGFAAYQQSVTINAKLDISEELARDKFGDETVDQARDWALQLFNTRPGFQQEVFRQRNPYRYVVEQYQRDQIANTVTPDDFKAFQEWRAQQQQPQPAVAAQPAPPQPQASAPPKSLATATSAGSPAPPKDNPEEQKLNAMFGA